MSKPKKGLGRGLEALLGSQVPDQSSTDHVIRLNINMIQTSRHQPREDFDEGALAELAQSIEKHGVLQPVLVRPAANGQYELIAGERRLRASKLAGLTEIPALVRDVNEQDHAAIALIENIQREDLNPLEEAQGIQKLIEEHQFTHEQVATTLGRSRSSVSNSLRLLALIEPVQKLLRAGDLDMGHARALLALPVDEQLKVANQIVANSLSVRETEQLVARCKEDQPIATTLKTAKNRNADIERLQNEVAETLALPVLFQMNAKGRGKITIQVGSLDEVDRFLEAIGYQK